MPMKPLSYHQIKRKLEKAGFTLIHQRGSHVKFVRKSEHEVRTVMVPNHREVKVGTLRSILRHAGLTVGEFERL
jgi:predicted RNA binding protein YcfA (HicA-like mRNA interferase family)